MKTFYSIWDNSNYFGSTVYFLEKFGFKSVSDPDQADFLVFNGGADIATEIYNEKPIFKGIPEFTDNRDATEISYFAEFYSLPKLGICRGAQLLNCLSGGTLWQHVNHHQSDHKMRDLTTGEEFNVTSTHHQMMRPTEDGQIIGVASKATTKDADPDSWHGAPDWTDVEVVWYPGTKSLCIQGHPEYVPQSRFAHWSVELLKSKFGY